MLLSFLNSCSYCSLLVLLKLTMHEGTIKKQTKIYWKRHWSTLSESFCRWLYGKQGEIGKTTLNTIVKKINHRLCKNLKDMGKKHLTQLMICEYIMLSGLWNLAWSCNSRKNIDLRWGKNVLQNISTGVNGGLSGANKH